MGRRLSIALALRSPFFGSESSRRGWHTLWHLAPVTLYLTSFESYGADAAVLEIIVAITVLASEDARFHLVVRA
jgi:hypothetical protein